MARVIGRLRIRAVKFTDARVHLIREVLNGIRVIKYNGWTPPFLQRIGSLRHKEIQKIKRASFVRASTSTLRDSVTPLASLVTFGTYFAIHNGSFMEPSKAFTVLALFSILVKTFSIAPLGVQAAGEAIVAIRRLQKLLELDYKNDMCNQDNHQQVCTEHSEKAVSVSDGFFSWDCIEEKCYNMPEGDRDMHMKMEGNVPGENSERPPADISRREMTLNEVNLVVKKGEFISIHGPVGSGKSLLLYAILGEMQCVKGEYSIHRNVAYVPQQPWILNATVWRNIIFTSPFDSERYQNTIAACALEHDISQFPGGHETEIVRITDWN